MGGLPSKPDRSKTMLVIGAGYSRTGTVSIQLALEKLLDGPVLHGGTHALFRESWFMKTWYDAYVAKRRGDRQRCVKLVHQVTDGFVGCVDLPAINFVAELIEAYPEAKVVLVTREPEKWWKSFDAVVLENGDAWYLPLLTAISPALSRIPPFVKEWKILTDSSLQEAGHTPGDYGPFIIETHNDIVRQVVPKDRLLEMRIEDGWEPLCKFLGKPVPAEPFPRVNDAEAAEAVVNGVVAKLLMMWAGAISVAGGGAYLAWRFWGSASGTGV
ncbi:hypothetical protein BX600DRAFT_248522 [Xylariales sp. PMI_506]|nr:hypothetical protein BX600DRAFT_248522 [Xylariales sp. PMI_506]